MDAKEIIARRAAQEINDGDVVNLGIGLPELITNYIPAEYDIWSQGDQGLIGRQRNAEAGLEDTDLIGSGNQYITLEPGACFMDSAEAFAVSRGGHIDVAVLGAFQVDSNGSVASHFIPGRAVSGMGGAMVMMTGAK